MKPIYTMLVLLCTLSIYAQCEYLEKLPDNPDPGKCYAKCIVPDEFEVRKEQIIAVPAHKTLAVVPAEYKLVKDEATREVQVPATYTTVEKRVLTKKGGMTAWREVPCTLPKDAIILPIHYELGSARLTAKSKSILDKHILSRLKQNPDVIVEVGSHTDARGSSATNQNLSERRSKSVVEYLN